ncbi:hypothetical protein BDV32DRAFT_117063 [Aspergillus pseudonomiae]|uniref:Mmc1 C-terminal domain-containing protein n=1 Tax=Aspergillus pseudonomiae TaxID=1506151 RepID=A0A5N7D780_9EURO|nr:uncharacterized protein BDV37DRAFT_162820 [Aspergillus pseudonomiae]KAB8265122.1 hypothetical protein BDV32DRAFT_117063 [Aspergillus pseudonomiae]KAE8402266.1 hypothetical protein BDV37DRAFT_162820 [Aspergillus pseudonomiae]
MPLKLRGSLSKSWPRAGDKTAAYYCPSCATRRRTLSTRRNGIVSSRLEANRLSFSSSRPITTSSVIHARHVPPRLRELYDALNKIQGVATEQVNISRLQLALRGLESETPIIRIAVLGLNDATAARKLVRLLLADPLNTRESWEDALDTYDSDPSQGLLIRYGEVSESIPNNLLPTISVPSPILKKGNLEILVSTLGAETELSDAHFTADTFLVPTVTIPTSHSGRHNAVRYPVHRTVVCGRGVDGLVAYNGLVSRADLKKETSSVYGAIDLAVTAPQKSNDRIAFVDIDRADEALEKFRESVQNASLYERGWNGSGVQAVQDWLSSLRAEGALDPSLKSLITSLIDAAETGVVADENKLLQDQKAVILSDEVRENLDRSVSEWAERGHTELRGSLEEGFATKKWKGLAWWKLFWHVDDVGMITSEILEKSYLPRAEKEVIWTAGRFHQAGLGMQLKDASRSAQQPSNDSTSDKPESDELWPTQITTSRNRLLETTVPSLQAMAQRLVLFSMSTTTLTSALSALTYVSVPTASVYETGTIVAVGLIYALRRQQKQWESARAFFEDEVREEGRTALIKTEEHLHTVVQEGGPQNEDVGETEARKTIDRARKALEQVD